MYQLDPAHLLSAQKLSLKACIKKTEIELKLLMDVDMLLTIDKGKKNGISYATYPHSAANNKYMKNYNQGKENHI